MWRGELHHATKQRLPMVSCEEVTETPWTGKSHCVTANWLLMLFDVAGARCRSFRRAAAAGDTLKGDVVYQLLDVLSAGMLCFT